MLPKIRRATVLLRDILQKPEPKDSAFKYRDIRFFFRFVKPVWKLGALGLLLTIATTALGSVLPLSTKAVIDFVIMKAGLDRVDGLLRSLNLESLIPAARHFLESIELIILAMIIAGVAIGLIGIAQRYLTFRFQQELTFNAQMTLFDHLLRFPISFFKKSQVGYLMSRVTYDVNALQYLFSQSLTQLAANVFYLLFGMAILFALSVRLSLISLCILPLYVLINTFFSGRLRNISRTERESVAQATKNIQEVISGVEVIKSHATESREVRRVSGKMRTVIQKRIRSMILSTLTDYSVQASQFVSTLVIMWFGVKEIQRGSMTLGDYVAFTAYVVYLSGSVRSLSLFHVTLQPTLAALDRLMELFRTVPEFGSREKSEDLIRLADVRGEIEFRDVSFAYDQNRPVLHDISFKAIPGESVALVGPSGAGKTTLANLILKFYTPQSGAIFLDDHDVNEIDPAWLRGQIGVVSQDVFLFNDTIENNIKYGKPGVGRQKVIEVARKAQIHHEVEELPDEYETVIGERGATLSAGQRQRISIARAFLRDPPILILDEPTSALDDETERLIKLSLKELVRNRTTIIISHRKSLLDIARRTLVLDRGRIIREM